MVTLIPKTVRVPHLFGVNATYYQPRQFDNTKPTLVLIHSFTTTSEQFRPQFEDEELSSRVNLLAIDVLDHGRTKHKANHWTYWDCAEVNIQVLDALGIRGKVFVLGVTQGGWIATRMALLAPHRIAGIIPIASTMDAESQRTRSIGCWDAYKELTPTINALTSVEPTPDFVAPQEFLSEVIEYGLGRDVGEDVRSFWLKIMTHEYSGNDGRRRLRMSTINLRDRDSLHARLFDVQAPVLWLHGTEDKCFSKKNAEEEIEMFTRSQSKELKVIEGGRHWLNLSHSKEVSGAVREFVGQYANMAHLTRVDRG